MTPILHTRIFALLGLLTIATAGCVFHTSNLEQDPVTLVPVVGNAPEQFRLGRMAKVSAGSFTTWLWAGSRWEELGSIPYGKVFNTQDQVLTVPSSDAYYQAGIVISNEVLTGFYLIAERTFTPVRSPVPLAISMPTGDFLKQTVGGGE